MSRRTIPIIPGQYYHIYNRGHNRSPIFFDTANYKFFLQKMNHYLLSGASEIIAYVLMPNHYHLLVQVFSENFTKAIQYLSVSYTKSINKGYQRTGSVFQGAFQSRLIQKNEYLLQLSRYIHRNPVEAGLVRDLKNWAFSSYLDYIGLRDGKIPSKGIILAQFATGSDRYSYASQYPAYVLKSYQDYVEGYQPAQSEIEQLMID